MSNHASQQSTLWLDSTSPNVWVCGVDEAGRGPLAGDVYAAAVILDPARPIAGLRDSKKLTAAKREQLRAEIMQHACAWAVATSTVAEIDQMNILQATLLAMQRAVEQLNPAAQEAWVDGNRAPTLRIPVHTLIQGDDLMPAISAASILAKTARDAAMHALHQTYPQYGFATHKGYGTAAHLQALQQYGACPAHRRSFAPVAKLSGGFALQVAP